MLATIAKKLIVKEDDSGYVRYFKVGALNDFKGRVENIKALDILKASTALHSRFKCLNSINKESGKNVWMFICFTVEQNRNKQIAAHEQSVEIMNQTAEPEFT